MLLEAPPVAMSLVGEEIPILHCSHKAGNIRLTMNTHANELILNDTTNNSVLVLLLLLRRLHSHRLVLRVPEVKTSGHDMRSDFRLVMSQSNRTYFIQLDHHITIVSRGGLTESLREEIPAAFTEGVVSLVIRNDKKIYFSSNKVTVLVAEHTHITVYGSELDKRTYGDRWEKQKCDPPYQDKG